MTSPYHPSAHLHHPGAYGVPHHNAPPGTFAPGTKVQVGNHRAVVEKYLSEGGFAHVYVVKVPSKSGDRLDTAVLKRVAVPDKEALANMRTEVETMKKLKGHRKIVTYIDSHASQLKGGGYEVFLLMEFCSGGGLIDFMNTRLQHRLTEPEILKIFSDVAEGVACMHYLKPPLLHRDLKVENVLIATQGTSKVYKLCDFGSSAPPRPAATTAAEGRLIEDDIQRHTTMQYRSPEMIDVYRKQPIDEKSDIWALGVLLYKLCYYTTPFEEQGQMAILNATYKFPHYPPFSDRTKKLIAWMLRENPQQRPNIYQVVREVCSMRNTECPITDIYANRSHSEVRNAQQLPSPDPQVASPPLIGIHKAAPVQQVQVIPEVTPMRRGRPTAPSQQPPAAKASPSPMRQLNDPFAALDSTSAPVRAAAADELASKFPSLDEFSILHDRGKGFQFSQQPSPVEARHPEPVNKRVTEALADQVFGGARPSAASQPPAPSSTSSGLSRSSSLRNAQSQSQPQPRREEPKPMQSSHVYQPQPQRTQMVSTGTNTSPPPSPTKYPDISQRPIYRFPPPGSQPSHQRGISQTRTSDNPRTSASSLQPNVSAPQRPAYIDMHRSKSSTTTLTLPQSPASSRPSLEGSRPSVMDITDPINRSKSANSRARPSSVHVESNLEYLRDRENSRNRVSAIIQDENELNRVRSPSILDQDNEQEKNITSNVDFLRSMEAESDAAKKKAHRRSGSHISNHSKRSSFPSLAGTKNILAGRFGDAFRRFEGGGGGGGGGNAPEPQRTPSPVQYDRPGTEGGGLAPIAGSDVMGERSEDESAIDETQDLPAEVRRELERRRLSQEEKRVAEAAAEYRKRVAAGGAGASSGPSHASSIQNRVKTLLEDSQQNSNPPKRTAEGYGRFTGSAGADSNNTGGSRDQAARPPAPAIAKKPTGMSATSASPVIGAQQQSELVYGRSRPSQQQQQSPAIGGASSTTASPAPPQGALPTGSSAASKPPPAAPPKPKALRTGGQFGAGGEMMQPPSPRKQPPPQRQQATGDVAASGGGTAGLGLGLQSIGDSAEDWEASFSKRYPSLSGLELVETEVPDVQVGRQGVRGR